MWFVLPTINFKTRTEHYTYNYASLTSPMVLIAIAICCILTFVSVCVMYKYDLLPDVTDWWTERSHRLAQVKARDIQWRATSRPAIESHYTHQIPPEFFYTLISIVQLRDVASNMGAIVHPTDSISDLYALIQARGAYLRTRANCTYEQQQLQLQGEKEKLSIEFSGQKDLTEKESSEFSEPSIQKNVKSNGPTEDDPMTDRIQQQQEHSIDVLLGIINNLETRISTLEKEKEKKVKMKRLFRL